MKKAGLVVAVEMEAVTEKYGPAEQVFQLPGYVVSLYRVDRYELYVVQSGAGEIAAAAATQLLISRFGAEMIFNFGVVGGLTDDMAVMRSCLVEQVVHYDMDTSQCDDIEVGRYLSYPTVMIPADPELLAAARAILPELPLVTCASADKFIADPVRKRELHEQFGADICEMEAAGIVLTANRNQVPCLLLKLVSDGIEGGAEEFNKECRRAARACIELLDRILQA